MNDCVVVLDNGASTIKVGVVNGQDDPEPTRYALAAVGSIPCAEQNRIIPNAVVQSKGDKATYFGHEFERCRDYSSLHYRLPFEKVWLPRYGGNS